MELSNECNSLVETSSLEDVDYNDTGTHENEPNHSPESVQFVNTGDLREPCSAIIPVSEELHTSGDKCSKCRDSMFAYTFGGDGVKEVNHSYSYNENSSHDLCLKEIKVLDMNTTDSSVPKQEDHICLQNYKQQTSRAMLSKPLLYILNNNVNDKIVSQPCLMTNVRLVKAKSETLLHILRTGTSFSMHIHCTQAGILMISQRARVQTGSECIHSAESLTNLFQIALLQFHKSICNSAVSEIVLPRSEIFDALSKEGDSGKWYPKYLSAAEYYFFEEEKEQEEDQKDDEKSEDDADGIEEEEETDEGEEGKEMLVDAESEKGKEEQEEDDYEVEEEIKLEELENEEVTPLTEEEQQSEDSDIYTLHKDIQNVEFKTHDSSSSGKTTNYGSFFSSHSHTRNRKLRIQLNTSSVRIDENDIELLSHLYDMFGEMVQIFESNYEFYCDVDKEVLNAFENHFADIYMLIAANRNKSGNSGYDPAQKPPGAGKIRTKNKKLGHTMTVPASSQSQSLQSCLDKARLASALQETIGRMKNKAENYAAVMAYEKSVSDLEKSMKDFLNARSSAEDETLREPLPTEPSRSSNEKQETKYQIRHNALRRFDTFFVADTGTTKLPLSTKRRNKSMSVKEQDRPDKMLTIRSTDNATDEKTLTVNNDSLKVMHISPTLLVAENSLDVPSSSMDTLHSCGVEIGQRGRRVSSSRWWPSSRQQKMLKDYLDIDSDFDTFGSHPKAQKTCSYINTSSVFTQLIDLQEKDKAIKERMQPHKLQANIDNSIGHINNRCTATSKVHLVNDKRDKTCGSIDSVGNNLLYKKPGLPNLPVKSLLFHQDSNASRKDKSDDEPHSSKGNDEQKLLANHLILVNDIRVQHNGPLNESTTVDSESTQSSCQNHDSTIYKEPKSGSLKAYTQNNESNRETTDSMIADDKKLCSPSSLSKYACDSARQQALCSVEEASGSMRKYEYNTSPLVKPRHEKVTGKKLYIKDPKTATISSEYSQGSSKNSSQESEGQKSYNKCRLPTEAKKHIFPHLFSDMFVSIADRSSSDEDAVDDLQSHVSPSDLLRHRQKADVDTKLQELNQYAQRRKKCRSSLRKRTLTGSPIWVENAGNVRKLNDDAQVTDAVEDMPDVTLFCSEQSDKKLYKHEYKAEQFKTEDLEYTCTDPQEDENAQVLTSVSQLFHAKILEEKETFQVDGFNNVQNETAAEVDNKELPATNKCDSSKASDDMNFISSINLSKNECKKVRHDLPPKERISATCSSISTTSDEYVLPESRNIKENKKQSDLKNNNYGSHFYWVSFTSPLQKMTQCTEIGVQRETLTCYSSSNIFVSTSATTKKSRSQEHQSSPSKATCIFSSASSCTSLDLRNTGVQQPRLSIHDLENNSDPDCHYPCQKATEIAQPVRGQLAMEPKVTKSAYPFCFVSLKEGFMQRAHQNNEHDPNNEKCERNLAGTIDDKHIADSAGKTDLETNKKYSVKSPPKCIYSNKTVSHSHLSYLPANPVALTDKGDVTRGSGEIGDKETYPFSINGDELDCTSPYENYQADIFYEPLKKNVKKQPMSFDVKEEQYFIGDDYFPFFMTEEKHEDKAMYKVVDPNFRLSFCSVTNCEKSDKDPSVHNLCQIMEKNVRKDMITPESRTQLQRQTVCQDLLITEAGDLQGVSLENECRAVKELRDKVEHLEKMLGRSQLRNQSFHEGNQSLHGEDSVSSPQPVSCPHCLQNVSVQNLIHTQMYSLKRRGCVLRPCCCTHIRDHGFNEHPRNSHFITPCNVHAQCSCFHHPVETHVAHTTCVDQEELTPPTSTACQTLENCNDGECLKMAACSCTDEWTQYDISMSHDGTAATCKFMEDQMSLIREDIREIKYDVAQETILSLHESLSRQKKEIEEIKSSMEKITSSIENNGHELVKKGVDYDKMKEQVVELTSQRDTEKVFHKITRQALRALERDHDRLRQEYISTNCRRYKHGNSIVQKRMWYYVNKNDNTHHYNVNHSHARDIQPTSQNWSAWQTERDENVSMHEEQRTCAGHFPRHHAQNPSLTL